MGLNLRRLRPEAVFDSFLGILDIKLGAEIILLFALINKVAGVYGFITIVVGGTFTQLAFYAYSIVTLFVLLWALKQVKAETSESTVLVAHLYTADHIVQSLFHYLFYYDYWYLQPHDGRRSINSRAQQDLIDLAVSRGEVSNPAGGGGDGQDGMRAALALEIWERERIFAIWTVILGFALKVYFIFVLYSYAAHLRSSTYHALPMTAQPRSAAGIQPKGTGLEGQRLVQSGAGGAGAPHRKQKNIGYVEDEEDFEWE
ncbi:Inositolphosphorylceramide synthase subunit Kei1-domain-containing protein [Kockovaella imperatae]|uniref:Inositolphosphorylceramide synthase subunit Kei1-domain-containing protein n=1 Tax=Kockovaella imperatae TaxID=4999 RepID=A0A1Y1UFN2_9TREE|nr:Inositolphosphorylceramide synthase subunit Kei1-domain-containing protein [Kockovaella imperatae]ORX36828.1 Inositolphosphorylceramide synthase subunit Kei1-domain-containing protein [Kockovaella imperatae]